MVHDPRVSACLARLGGVYRDPTRVDRDTASLLKSSVGSHLIPIVAEMYENNGKRTNVLVLQGTIAMHFRAQTYQLLMDIYLPAGYPTRPPVPYVRLAPNMYLKENHPHVGSDGKVYLPYLHEWRSNSHNMVELVVAMSSVFSADPPVFTRRSTDSATSSSTTTAQGFGSTTRPAMDTSAAAAGAMMSDEEALLAVQAQVAADEARQRQEEERRRQEEERKERERLEAERERQQAVDAQRAWEIQRTEQVRVQVTAKIRQQLQTQARQTQHTIGTELEQDLMRLQLAKEQKIEAPLTVLKEQQQELEQQLAVAEECKTDILEWIEQAEAAKSNNESAALSIDDQVVPEKALHAQMMDLSAENAALTDALFFIDRAMHQGHLTSEQHLKQVRRLAKKQFMVRAHLIKINQVVLANPSHR